MPMVCDSHYHLNMKMKNPVVELCGTFERGLINRCVLILNEKEEMECLFNNYKLIEKHLNKIHFALLLDPHDSSTFEYFKEIFDSKGIRVSIKLHPRISDIKKADFDKVIELLAKYEYKNIIVDGIFYGSCIDNFIAIELVIFLAEKLKNKKIVLAHFGGHKVLEALLYTRQLNNVFYDISCSVCYFRGTSVMMDLMHSVKYSERRVMIGSDYPMFTIEEACGSFEEINVNCEFREEILNLIYWENARNIYFDD